MATGVVGRIAASSVLFHGSIDNIILSKVEYNEHSHDSRCLERLAVQKQ